jgi:Cof subfamily protein (haloacid dehalogenase superfamily)
MINGVSSATKGTTLNIKVYEKDGKGVVAPFGRLDTDAAGDFENAISRATRISRNVVLDFGGAQLLTSSCIRVIINAAKDLNGSGSLEIVHVSDEIMEVLDLTGLLDILEGKSNKLPDGNDIRVLFFDVDGTLLSHSQGIIPQNTLDALAAAQKRGVRVVIATGRDIIELDKLPIHDFPWDGFLTLNGNICLDANRKMFAGNEMDAGEVEVLVSIFQAGKVPFVLLGKDTHYINYVDDVVIRTQLSTHGTIPSIGQYQGEKIYQCIAFVDAQTRKRLESMLDKCSITSWNETGIDIIAKTGGKDAGINKFLEREGLERIQSMAFGDGENDMSMLRYCGIGVAMGNGKDSLKEMADYVTTSVDDDGIGNALRHFGVID